MSSIEAQSYSLGSIGSLGVHSAIHSHGAIGKRAPSRGDSSLRAKLNRVHNGRASVGGGPGASPVDFPHTGRF